MPMKLRPIILAICTFFAAGILTVAAQPSNAISSSPVFVPDYSHSTEPLPDGVLAWDALVKNIDATNEQEFANFSFTFTNVAGTNVTVLTVQPSCGCTTAELPPVPWTLPPGTNGEIKLNVHLAGKSGKLFKTVSVSTDKGSKTLQLHINILPPPPMPEMTEAQRDAGIAAAKADRQVVFKGDCASCHLKKVQGKYGQQLFEAICAICHEAKNRATMVPDLANLQVPTNEEFWRAWITSGKAGSLMPAFATSQGGPLNDLQIASLAAYLNAIHPSRVPAPTTK